MLLEVAQLTFVGVAVGLTIRYSTKGQAQVGFLFAGKATNSSPVDMSSYWKRGPR